MELPGYELLTLMIPVLLFSFSMSVTPGPNNVMLTASGANYGFVRSIPHMLGITAGVMLLMSSVALGLGILFEQWPVLMTLLKILGSGYLLWLGWKIFHSPPPEIRTETAGSPLTFFQAAMFQFVNPKAWMMAISALASFTLSGDAFVTSVVLIILAMAVVNLPSIALWASFGVLLGRLLKTPRHWRVFNRLMGGLTASCVVMILI
ncbi:lysine exporter protein LysE/YggA [Nitrincola sp. A-D6]|uniref:LysE family translocator n=1 Tax=Nitrincola sp. A-D6 TaxID=1545442 RepID=UPI00051FCDFA|nr:LysE family translocator [Nitrincola sp. A-D6]KGK43124.1 lysine exporter protein LysE/YggA [Nitrincola sp. A-D6]